MDAARSHLLRTQALLANPASLDLERPLAQFYSQILDHCKLLVRQKNWQEAYDTTLGHLTSELETRDNDLFTCCISFLHAFAAYQLGADGEVHHLLMSIEASRKVFANDAYTPVGMRLACVYGKMADKLLDRIVASQNTLDEALGRQEDVLVSEEIGDSVVSEERDQRVVSEKQELRTVGSEAARLDDLGVSKKPKDALATHERDRDGLPGPQWKAVDMPEVDVSLSEDTVEHLTSEMNDMDMMFDDSASDGTPMTSPLAPTFAAAASSARYRQESGGSLNPAPRKKKRHSKQTGTK